ncbi:MAG: hypothetical protein LBQ12_07905 [Deltaproteobacteria bacterium]|jgi:hypothetical protein|nr:hypothetical protein [Deltaproteobacteria bacterium]
MAERITAREAASLQLGSAEGGFSADSRLGLDVSDLELFVMLKSASEIDDGQRIKNLTNLLFTEAFEWHVSDILLEPSGSGYRPACASTGSSTRCAGSPK